MSHVHLFFQARMYRWLHTPDCKVLNEVTTTSARKRWTMKQNGGEHRESNSGPLLPESRIIPLDHAPLTGGNVERPLQWANRLFLTFITTLLTSSHFDTSNCANRPGRYRHCALHPQTQRVTVYCSAPSILSCGVAPPICFSSSASVHAKVAES